MIGLLTFEAFLLQRPHDFMLWPSMQIDRENTSEISLDASAASACFVLKCESSHVGMCEA
jgi:hypothetical protein